MWMEMSARCEERKFSKMSSSENKRFCDKIQILFINGYCDYPAFYVESEFGMQKT